MCASPPNSLCRGQHRIRGNRWWLDVFAVPSEFVGGGGGASPGAGGCSGFLGFRGFFAAGAVAGAAAFRFGGIFGTRR